MNRPFFSVIIPTYNRADFIEQTIASVLNQDFEDFELIIVDDGSTDNTAEVVDKISDNRISYYKKENAERGAARNFGALKSLGKYVTFLDSDDLLYENHLLEAYNYSFKYINNVNIFFQQYELLKKDGTIIQPYKPKISPINIELVKHGNFMSCHGVFIKRQIFNKYQFKENRYFNMGEDYELWLRLSVDYKILYSPLITSVLIQHSNRSVEDVKPSDIIRKKLMLLDYLKNDKNFIEKISSNFKYIEANTYLYIALHLSMNKFARRSDAFYFLIKSIKKSINTLLKRSFFVCVYKIAFTRFLGFK